MGSKQLPAIRLAYFLVGQQDRQRIDRSLSMTNQNRTTHGSHAFAAQVSIASRRPSAKSPRRSHNATLTISLGGRIYRHMLRAIEQQSKTPISYPRDLRLSVKKRIFNFQRQGSSKSQRALVALVESFSRRTSASRSPGPLLQQAATNNGLS